MLIMSQLARRLDVPDCCGKSFELWTAAGGQDAADCSTVWQYVMQAKLIAPLRNPKIDAALQAFMDEWRSVLPDSFA